MKQNLKSAILIVNELFFHYICIRIISSTKLFGTMKQLLIIALLALGITFPLNIYSQNNLPCKKERIYSLSMIWKELEYNFAFPSYIQRHELDSLYLEYLPKIENVKDEYEYYRILSSFMANMNESHTRIIPPQNLPYDMPPIITSNIGKHIYVKNIDRKILKSIPLKSEITAVNGIPVMDFLIDSVYQYIGASTAHWKFDKAVTEMLYGKINSKVHLSIKTPKGKKKDIELTRNLLQNKKKIIMADTAYTAPMIIKYLKGSIAYIHLSTCAGNKVGEIQQIFYRNLQKLLKCKGLIVDVRGNRGGTDQAWYLLAYCSMPGKEFRHKGKWVTRKHIASYKGYGSKDRKFEEYFNGLAMEEIHYPPYKNGVPDSLKLTQPMVILSGQYVGSAAEDFVQLMKENNRAVIVGEPTVGCIGEPMLIELPCGYKAMISAKAYITNEGSQLNDTGILPDIEVKPDFIDFLKGEDNQLNMAIDIITTQIVNFK